MFEAWLSGGATEIGALTAKAGASVRTGANDSGHHHHHHHHRHRPGTQPGADLQVEAGTGKIIAAERCRYYGV